MVTRIHGGFNVLLMILIISFLLNEGFISAMNDDTSKLIITNNCGYRLWPVVVPDTVNEETCCSGFELGPTGDSRVVPVSPVWSSATVWAWKDSTINGSLECSCSSFSVARVKLNSKPYIYEVTVVDVPITITVDELEEHEMSTPTATTFRISFCSSARRQEARNGHKSNYKRYLWKCLDKIVFIIIGVLVTLFIQGMKAMIKYFRRPAGEGNRIPIT